MVSVGHSQAKELSVLFKGFDRKQLFENVVSSIAEPSDEQKVFALPYDGQKLSAAIVEPRQDVRLKHILYNMAHVYGGTNVSLYIFHGTKNEDFVKDIIKGWKNVQLINLKKESLSYPKEVNDLFLDVSFYQTFKSEFVLTFQTDSLLRRPIDEVFFKYEYVGGPWASKLGNDPDRRVGNGGFSLRKVSTMINISKSPRPFGWRGQWEDQAIVSYIFHILTFSR
jgi:hypothetical protein